MGTLYRFDSDVDTDQIIASQYLLYPTIEEMKGHTFESLDPEFANKVKPGDYVVANENFGCGSSREQAPGVLKALGVKAVIAKSFARIFYRNSINIGMPILECPAASKAIREGDVVSVNFDTGVITDETTGETFEAMPFPPFIQNIIQKGGLMNSLKGE